MNGRSPASLVWSGDELVDWVDGGARYRLDGSHFERQVNYAFDFDMAVAHGDYAVICQRFGTKGLILRVSEILREINRSYYFASTFDFPVCLWTGANGRVLIAHCPEAYNRIEIDDVETGERLTAALDRKPQDFFYSRLQTSPGGANLISAGWVWHPLQLLSLFNIKAALKDPSPSR